MENRVTDAAIKIFDSIANRNPINVVDPKGQKENLEKAIEKINSQIRTGVSNAFVCTQLFLYIVSESTEKITYGVYSSRVPLEHPTNCKIVTLDIAKTESYAIEAEIQLMTIAGFYDCIMGTVDY